MKLIKESTHINASKEKIWQILFDKDASRIWYSEFSKGSHAIGTWEKNTPMIFIDYSKEGLGVIVKENKLNETMSVEYIGAVINGELDQKHEETKLWKGLKESYYLMQKDKITTLSIETEVPDGFKEILQSSWLKALQKIKEVAEQVQRLEDVGYKNVRVCPMPSKGSPEHIHEEATIHILLNGNLKVKDSDGTKTYRNGEKIEFPAGTVHTAECDVSDGLMIAGEK
jgi:quercetin dioxygenase-like cupin family protein